MRTSDIRLQAADREYGSFDDVDDPLAFAVLSMERALEELDQPGNYEVGCLQHTISVCKRAMNRREAAHPNPQEESVDEIPTDEIPDELPEGVQKLLGALRRAELRAGYSETDAAALERDTIRRVRLKLKGYAMEVEGE